MKYLKILYITFTIVFISNINVYAYSLSKNSIEQGWQFRLGDSPIDKEGIPVWIKGNGVWKPLDNISKPINNVQCAWFRVKIPVTRLKIPTIYFEKIVGQNVAVYLNSDLVYHKEGKKNSVDINQLIVPINKQNYVTKSI
jgi:hypothetical protein